MDDMFKQLSKNQVEVKYQVLNELLDRVKNRRSISKIFGILPEGDNKDLVEIMGDAMSLGMQEQVYKGKTRISCNDIQLLMMDAAHYVAQFRNTGTKLLGDWPTDYSRKQLDW